jgi:hypothetical protein
MSGYVYTNDWFATGAASDWAEFVPIFEPKAYLEIGSYEGASTCWIIENTQVEQIVCVDTWTGGQEHRVADHDMQSVEGRFDRNIGVAGGKVSREVSVTKLKNLSSLVLPELLAKGLHDSFDVIYVDGSHEPSDVLSDAVMAFALCRPGGLIIFDDYVWWDQTVRGIASSPKLAIDAFTSCYFDRLGFLRSKLGQMFCVKKMKVDECST